MEQPQAAPATSSSWDTFKENVSLRVKAAADKLNIKSTFLIHFSLSSLIMVGSYGGIGYMFHSLVLLLLLLYSIHMQSNCDVIAFVIFVEFSSFFLELNYLIFHAYLSFAIFFVIVHMLFRILAVFSLLKEFHLRGGNDIYNSLFSMPLRSYDDLERPHLNVPSTTSDYTKVRVDKNLPL